MRPIDADAFDATLRDGEVRALKMHNTKLSSFIQMIRGNLRKAPTVELKREVGHWMPFEGNLYKCSNCGAVREQIAFSEHFCPNCGADMRGGKNDKARS